MLDRTKQATALGTWLVTRATPPNLPFIEMENGPTLVNGPSNLFPSKGKARESPATCSIPMPRRNIRSTVDPSYGVEPDRMAAARARVLRELPARCWTKCLRRASPFPSTSPAASSLSSLSRAATSPFLPASRSRRLLHSPLSAAARVRAQLQTRFLASEAARRGVGGRGPAADSEEEVQEWAVEWEDSEDDGYEPEVATSGSATLAWPPGPPSSLRLAKCVSDHQRFSPDRRRRGRRRGRAAGRRLGRACPRGGRGGSRRPFWG
jgi:hypothetical protein